MKSQLILLILCFITGIALAEDSKGRMNDHEIQGILKNADDELRKLNHKVHGVSNSQKGIDEKIKQQRDDLEGIARLEDGLVKLQDDTAHSFRLTANGVTNLSANIRSFEVKNDKALQNLGKTELQIKELIGKVDVDQNKNTNEMKVVSKLVEKHLADLNKLLKESVLNKLVSLERTAKKMESTQKNIENKASYLDELNNLADRANYKADQLEQNLQQLNYSQNKKLAAIGESIHDVEVGVEHLDKKLDELVSNQKGIKENLKECTKWKHLNKPKNVEHIKEPRQPDYTPSFGLKQEQFSYASAEGGSYLDKLWYGKIQI